MARRNQESNSANQGSRAKNSAKGGASNKGASATKSKAESGATNCK